MKALSLGAPIYAGQYGALSVSEYKLDLSKKISCNFQYIVANGLAKTRMSKAVLEAKYIDELYRDRNSDYLEFVNDFVESASDYDAVIMSTFNPVHPEILRTKLKNKIKVMGFCDDPMSTYTRGLPYMWAFDGAFYISPSYNERASMKNILEEVGCRNMIWMPLVREWGKGTESESLPFKPRRNDICYVGNPTATKYDRLISLKKEYGNRFKLHGRWRFNGLYGCLGWLNGKQTYMRKIRSLSGLEKEDLYLNTKIGLNMHVSSIPAESGNMRMYEIPAHGMMQICDKAALSLHEEIFEDGVECVYYDNNNDLMEKINFYLSNDGERCRIASAGHKKVHLEYGYQKQMTRFAEWLSAM